MAIFDLFNAIAGWGSDDELFGKKPVVPEYPTSDQILGKVVAANTSNLPGITALLRATNRTNSELYQEQLRQNLPGYDELLQTVGQNAEAASKGILPPDVVNMLQRTTAESALRGGYQGSQVADWSLAQNLGLTSLQMQSTLDRWLDTAQKLTTPGFMDVSRMFISPAQQMQISEGNFQRDLLAAGVAAAPDPAKRGVLDLEMQVLGEILSIYGGGAGYTGTYRPSYGGGGGGGGGSPGAIAGGGYGSPNSLGGWNDSGMNSWV